MRKLTTSCCPCVDLSARWVPALSPLGGRSGRRDLIGTCSQQVPRHCCVRPSRPVPPIFSKGRQAQHDADQTPGYGRRRRARRQPSCGRARRTRAVARRRGLPDEHAWLPGASRLARGLRPGQAGRDRIDRAPMRPLSCAPCPRRGSRLSRSISRTRTAAAGGAVLGVRKTTRGKVSLCLRLRPDAARLHERCRRPSSLCAASLNAPASSRSKSACSTRTSLGSSRPPHHEQPACSASLPSTAASSASAPARTSNHSATRPPSPASAAPAQSPPPPAAPPDTGSTAAATAKQTGRPPDRRLPAA
jgi:hypothetical protein